MGTLKLLHQRTLALRLLILFTTALILLYLMTDLQPEIAMPRRPPPAMYHDEHLLNLANFHLITSPHACQSRQEVKALLVVTSHSGNVDVRMAWRNGMPTKVLTAAFQVAEISIFFAQTLDELKVRRVFLVALPKPYQLGYDIVNETLVRYEADEYRDIVQVH
jgi:hypothetical protein